MEKWWFNSMLFNKKVKYRCGLSKSIDSFDPIENTSVSEDLPILTDMDKNIHSWNNSENSSYSNVDYLIGVRNIRNLLSDKTFLVRDSKRKSFSIYFAIENQNFEIDNDHSFLNEPESFFSSYKNSSYLKNSSKSDDDHYMYDTKSIWNNNINSCIESYLRSHICIDSDILDDSDKYNDSDFNSDILDDSDFNSDILDDSDFNSDILDDSDKYNDSDFNSDICGYGKGRNSSESKSTSIITNTNETNDSDFTQIESSTDSVDTQKYKHLWVECEDCYGLNYKRFFKSKMNICEHCGSHLKMSSSDRIELSIDPGTWNPMDEDMVSLDPIEFDSEEEPYQNHIDSYQNRIDSYQKKTGLTEAVQTGTGQLNGISVAIGIMDFQFMGGSMGSVVGEKITRLIEYATNQFLPLILVCASGGARMQEGSLSLMQMAKISCALYDYQINKKLFYVSILTSPTTGGVTASFGMLGDIIIAEPNAYIAFAGKRVIEQTLNTEVPEGVQSAEFLFEKGLFDSIVPRNPLKEVLSELFQLHAFFPLPQNEKESRN